MLEAPTKPPMTEKELADNTAVDPILAEVFRTVKHGEVKKLERSARSCIKQVEPWPTSDYRVNLEQCCCTNACLSPC